MEKILRQIEKEYNIEQGELDRFLLQERKRCVHCGRELTNLDKKYCSDYCKQFGTKKVSDIEQAEQALNQILNQKEKININEEGLNVLTNLIKKEKQL